jgi:hypothetical protein
VSSGLAGAEQSPVAASSAERLSLGVGRRVDSLCAGVGSVNGTNPQHAT